MYGAFFVCRACSSSPQIPQINADSRTLQSLSEVFPLFRKERERMGPFDFFSASLGVAQDFAWRLDAAKTAQDGALAF
jgi:hypothetical protein